MLSQPVFATPGEVIAFLRDCLQQNDINRLYAAFSEETSSFWRERIFQVLQEIDHEEMLESVFLENNRITAFPQDESTLHLGGHNPHTRYLHLKLVKAQSGWGLVSIHVCR